MALKEAKVGKEDTKGRQAKAQKLKELREEKERLEREIGQLAEQDPETMENRKQLSEAAKEAANRWTGNLFSFAPIFEHEYLIRKKKPF